MRFVYMADTTIRVSESLRDELEERKGMETESFNHLIERMLRERDNYKELAEERNEQIGELDQYFIDVNNRLDKLQREIEDLRE